MKVCTKCKKSRYTIDFNRNASTNDGYARWCRECAHKAHNAAYEKNIEHYTKKNWERRRLVREYVREFKQRSNCVDCGESRWQCLSFDHLGDKSCNLADIEKKFLSLDRVQQEIDKCEVVCHNCHAMRTHDRRTLGSSLMAGRLTLDQEGVGSTPTSPV